LHTFKGVAARAGLNPMNYVQVNIREQCSWPHSDHPREATVKAAGLIRAGINRVSFSESLENIEVPVKKAALVIGAGVSGMKAALDLSRLGNEVFLIEQAFTVGGQIAAKSKVFTSNQSGKEIVDKLYQEIRSRENITLFTGASLEKVSGSLGNFNVEIKVMPHETLTNTGLTKKNFDFSSLQVGDKGDRLAFLVGSILVATGYDHYQPAEGEFDYKTLPNVVTLPEFTKLMDSAKDKLVYDGRTIKSVGFIYCVGSRQTKGENKYCSRQCCTATIHTSLQLKEKFSDIQTYHFYRDIRTYGKQEVLYEQSSKQGDLYFKYEEKEKPEVYAEGKQTWVKVKDYLTAKKEIEAPVDLVVLVTGMVARQDAGKISEHLKIPIGSDKFFNEIHPKLKPVETVIKGVYIGGSCQGPKNISESVQSTLAATAKMNALLQSGSVSVDPIVASVDASKCLWCGKCADVCDYGALKEVEDATGKHIAVVNKGVCTGCGICTPICPENAIEVAQYTDHEIEAMIQGFMTDFDIKERVKATDDSSDEAATTMKEYPQVWKDILAGIKDEKNTIPEIAANSGLSADLVTWHLMTMNRYAVVVADGTDEDQTYFYYKKKH
jgi:heterodisulfide reductase subunit A